jgi:hypothetical protein
MAKHLVWNKECHIFWEFHMKRIVLVTLIAAIFFLGCQSKLSSINADPNIKSSTPIVSRPYWITVNVRNDETFTMLYEFFKDELQFPVYFHPEKWGHARYTAIYAGNVMLEICGPFPIPGTELMARYNTLGFRPFESLQASADELTRRRIHHDGPPKPGSYAIDVFDLEIPVNISAVKDPNEVSRREALRAELRARNGGPIGLKNVKELYIGYNSRKRLEQWIDLIKPAKHKKNLWYLPEEPNLRFVEGESERIRAIVLKVESLKKATDYLKRNDMLGNRSRKSVEITKTKTGGLRIILEE